MKNEMRVEVSHEGKLLGVATLVLPPLNGEKWKWTATDGRSGEVWSKDRAISLICESK
jgi:hypothetical protein